MKHRRIRGGIAVSKKIARASLPSKTTLYVVDSDHFLISSRRDEKLETRSLFKTEAKVILEDEDNIIFLPKTIYDFYHLDENDYTAMIAEKDNYSHLSKAPNLNRRRARSRDSRMLRLFGE